MIVFKNVSFSYHPANKDVRPLFSSLHLEVARGEHLAITGKNGSGKSTLAALIKGLLTPQEGKIFYFDRDITEGGINHRIGYLYSNPENQIVSPVVEDDIAFGPENYGYSHKQIVQAVKHSLSETKSMHLREELTHQLSGGQQQRINMAGVLALDLDCIILDEAASMLDPVARRDLHTLIRKICRENGLSLIQLTHDAEEVLLADRVLVLSKGSVVFDGPPQDFIHDENILAALSVSDDSMIALLRRLIKEKIIRAEDVRLVTDVASAIKAFKKNT